MRPSLIGSSICEIIRSYLTKEHTEVGIGDFHEIWRERSFQKNTRPLYFSFSFLFWSAMIDVEEMKTTFKVGGAKHILPKYLGNDWRLVFLNDEFNGVYRFAKESHV